LIDAAALSDVLILGTMCECFFFMS